MSAPSHDHAHDYGHDDHGHGHGHEPTYRGYLTGFILSVILTAIPFWIVMTGALSNQAAAGTIMVFAIIQIVVHMIYFLHMDRKSEGGWNMMAMIFTVVIVIIALSGSMWVMYHMNANMMPVSVEDMSQMP